MVPNVATLDPGYQTTMHPVTGDPNQDLFPSFETTQLLATEISRKLRKRTVLV